MEWFRTTVPYAVFAAICGLAAFIFSSGPAVARQATERAREERR